MNVHLTTNIVREAAYFLGSESAFAANVQNERAIIYVPFSPLFPFGTKEESSLSPFPRVSKTRGKGEVAGRGRG